MAKEIDRLKIHAKRGGSIKEIISFLSDLNTAYNSLVALEEYLDSSYYWVDNRYLKSKYPLFDFWYPNNLNLKLDNSDEIILPEFRLYVEKIEIQSPGFWEVVGSLNPLQQIREYLNDRHKRRQDREYREESEKKKLQLENELTNQQIDENRNIILKERIEILTDLGYSKEDIRKLIWANLGNPLAQLGRHQDNDLIEGAE